MISYILKRLLLMIPTLFGILLITFAIIQFVPGGPVEQMVQTLTRGDQHMGGGEVGQARTLYRGTKGVDPQKLEEIKKLYGFDQPVHERFWLMLKNFAQFDLGKSFFHDKTVWQLLLEKLPVSISLGLWSFLLAYGISIPLGIAKAVRHGSKFDAWTSVAILIGYAIPGFVLGVALLVLLGGGSFLQIFPLRGLTSEGWETFSLTHKILDYFWHLILPITCMTVSSFAVVAIMTKNSFLEEIRKQYVLTARAKGLSEKTVLYKHVFRNACIPVVTGFPQAFIGIFFTGAILIEGLFSLDGLGLLSLESVMKRDYPVVLGSLYFFSILSLLAKLLNDLMYVWIDPRIKFTGRG